MTDYPLLVKKLRAAAELLNSCELENANANVFISPRIQPNGMGFTAAADAIELLLAENAKPREENEKLDKENEEVGRENDYLHNTLDVFEREADENPVTRKWWNKFLKKHFDGREEVSWCRGDGEVEVLLKGGRFVLWVMSGEEDHAVSIMDLPAVRTRGDVRQLIRLLGMGGGA